MKVNKKIKKIGISLAIVLSIITPNYVFANNDKIETSENLEFLSYEKAIKLAIDESNEIKNLKLEKDSNTIKIDDALDNFGYNPE